MHRVWSTMNLLQDRSSDRTDDPYERTLDADSDVARQKRGNGRKGNG
jgi:hypothetical protein